MSGYRDKLVLLIAIGVGFGAIFGVILVAILANEPPVTDGRLFMCSSKFLDFIGNPILALTIEVLLFGLHGAVVLGSSIVYYLENWSILKATAVHFIITITANYTMYFILMYVSPTDLGGILFYFIIFVIVYILIWAVQYITYRIQVKEINRELQLFKSKSR